MAAPVTAYSFSAWFGLRIHKTLRCGVFGVPSFFVNGELFFGQDRLEFVVEALQRS